MTAEELGKTVWDKLPPVYGPADEKESMRLIGEAILAERERCALIAESACICGRLDGSCEGCWAAKEIRKT